MKQASLRSCGLRVSLAPEQESFLLRLSSDKTKFILKNWRTLPKKNVHKQLPGHLISTSFFADFTKTMQELTFKLVEVNEVLFMLIISMTEE